MTTKPDYDRGYRDAIRATVTWLHKRANEMNDGHARSLYNLAASDLGMGFEGAPVDGRRSGVASPKSRSLPPNNDATEQE